MPSTETWIAIIAGLFAVASAAVTGRLNWKTVRQEKTLPPYEVLAKRVSGVETDLIAARKEVEKLEDDREKWQGQAADLERRAGCLETGQRKLEEELGEDREWIKRVIVVAEARGALDFISPLPEWVDLGSESMRKRRERLDGGAD